MFSKKLTKDKIKRIKYIKYEIEVNLLLSLYKNQNIGKNKKSLIFLMIFKKNVFRSKNRNFCISTQRARGIWRITNLSRHKMNKLIGEGYLVNYTSFNNR